MAFIVDIRRGNLRLHLMYKALFELSADRAEFVSRLFSRKRPGRPDRGIDGARNLRGVLDACRPSEGLFDENLRAIDRQPAGEEARLRASADDLAGISYVYNAFS